MKVRLIFWRFVLDKLHTSSYPFSVDPFLSLVPDCSFFHQLVQLLIVFDVLQVFQQVMYFFIHTSYSLVIIFLLALRFILTSLKSITEI